MESKLIRSMREEAERVCLGRSGYLVNHHKMQDIRGMMARLEAFELLGREPNELKRMIDMLEDPAPLPMTEDYRTSCGLLEDDDLELAPGVEGPYVNNDWEDGL